MLHDKIDWVLKILIKCLIPKYVVEKMRINPCHLLMCVLSEEGEYDEKLLSCGKNLSNS